MTRSQYLKLQQIFLFSLLLIISACNKDDNNNQPLPQNYIYDGCIPSKKEFLDFDTREIEKTQTFKYTDGRLSSIIDSDGTIQTYEYEGDLVSKIAIATQQNSLHSYWAYEYNSNNQMIKMQYFLFTGGSYTLLRELNYTYENDVLKEADMFYRGTDSKLVYFFDGTRLDSIEFYENNEIQRKEAYEWDGKNNEYVNLNIPIAHHFETPVPFGENVTKIIRKQYDPQGALLHTGTSLCQVTVYNPDNFPVRIQCSSTPEHVFEYVNCP